MRRLLFLIAVLVVSVPSYGSEWESSAYSDDTFVWVNTDSISKVSGSVSYWTAYVNIDKKLPYDTELLYCRTDCSTGRTCQIESSFYLKGKLKNSRQYTNACFQPVPGTLGDAQYKVACGKTSFWETVSENFKNVDELTRYSQDRLRKVGNQTKTDTKTTPKPF